MCHIRLPQILPEKMAFLVEVVVIRPTKNKPVLSNRTTQTASTLEQSMNYLTRISYAIWMLFWFITLAFATRTHHLSHAERVKCNKGT